MKKIDRRKFLRGSAYSAAMISLSNALKMANAQGDKKNVLFISIDDMSDWAGPFGTSYQTVHTPGIDKLAAMGTTFTRAYCAAPACGPSRTAVMSGVHPLGYSDEGWGPFRNYVGNTKVIPQLFKDAGYNVMGAGKLFHGIYSKDEKVEWQDQNYEAGIWSNYYKMPPDPQIHPNYNFSWGPLYSGNEESMPDRKILRWAKDRLSEQQTDPFFLGVGFYRPHLPWFVPQKYFDMYPLDGIRVPDVPLFDLNDVPAKGRALSLGPDGKGDHANVIAKGEWKKAVQAYLASITFADNCLLELINTFQASPHKDNTIIVLWTDHGWHLGEKLGWRKFKLWERATKVPLLMAGPGIAAGVKNDNIVSLMDVKPTLTDLAMGMTTTSEHGTSLKSVLQNPNIKTDRKAVTSWGDGNDRHVSVRSGRWRYILYSDGSQELYDHSVDPKEHVNLLSKDSAAAKLAGVVSSLRSVVGK